LPAFVLHGTKGSFIKQRADVQEAALINQAIPFTEQWGEEPATAMGLLHIEKDGQDYSTYIPTLKGNYGAFYEGMYQTITHQAACLVTGQDGWNVMTIIEAAQKSHAQQSVVNISV
jgi:scyllo-inositol 2-dehydrogenase (NADP+)